MIGPRLEFRLDLVTLTALHVGTGEQRESDAEDTEGSIAAIARDHGGRPYLPGASLKGCLKRLVPPSLAMFGGEEQTGPSAPLVTGRVIFNDAYLAEGSSVDTRPNARVAIDASTGVAEKARLFTRDEVLPGAVFRLELACPARPSDELERDIATLLAKLTSEEGVQIGKATRQGQGRLRADLYSLQVRRRLDDPAEVTEDWKERISRAATSREQRKTACFSLTSDAPFLISDPARTPPKNDKTTPQIRGRLAYAPDTEADLPELSGSTLLGALRARCAWAEAIRDAVTDDKDEVLLDWRDATGLTKTQRLFGVTGWRGQLSVDWIALIGTPPLQSVTSVRIDRFSAAPIDNALYTVESWLAPRFDVRLSFDPRYSAEADEDWAFFESVLKDLGDDIWGGLDLGLGKSRGFGTFRLERTNG